MDEEIIKIHQQKVTANSLNEGLPDNSLASEIYEIEDCEPEELESDDLGHAIQTFDQILSFDWLDEFPLNEEDKRRFSDKYSVANPTGKNGLMYRDKIVQLNITNLEIAINNLLHSTKKENIVETAKEIIFAEEMFGSTIVFSVAEILISRVAKGKLRLSLLQRLAALLVIHIVLVVEAKVSLNIYERPFNSAFSTDAFVMNFKYLVEDVNNMSVRQQLYYVRIVWENCFLEEILDKIDEDDFWISKGIQLSALSTGFVLGTQCNAPIFVNDDPEVLIVESADKSEHKKRNISENSSETASPSGMDKQPSCEESQYSKNKKKEQKMKHIGKYKICEPKTPTKKPVKKRKMIEDLKSNDFIDNLLTDNLNFVFTKNGVQVIIRN